MLCGRELEAEDRTETTLKRSKDKTLAIRRLEQHRVPHEVSHYPAAERDAERVADHLGVPASSLYKTLVVLASSAGDRPVLAMIAADRQLDLRSLACALGWKKAALAPQREAERLTGMRAGGISALCVRSGAFDVVIDEALRSVDEVFVSAGRRGINVRVPVEQLVLLCQARWAKEIGIEPRPSKIGY